MLPASAAPQDKPAPGARPKVEAPTRALDIDTLLEPIRAKHGVLALGGAIVGLDGPLEYGATGVRRHGKDVRVTKHDLWHIGSCTKSMTATLVARMVEQKRLAWDTTLAKAFPDLAKKMDPGWRNVPLDLLLANRSGAPPGLDEGGLWARLRSHRGTPREQRRTLVEGVLLRPPPTPPGTKNVYSNAGFAIAGAAAETRAGVAWEELMRKELFEPLGMERAGFGPPGDPKALDQPWAHRGEGAAAVGIPPGPGADNPAAIGPAGIVHCSLADWSRYVALHLRGAAGKSTLLRPETFRKLHTPLEGQNYALGWVATERPWARPPPRAQPRPQPRPGAPSEGARPEGAKQGRVLFHNGSNTMWYAVAWLAPDRGFAVLATCNQAGEAATKACDAVASALIRRHLQSLR